MKNVAIAGAVAAALCLTGLTQRASAQDCRRGFDVSANVGLTFGLHWTPLCGNKDGCGAYGYPGCGYAGAPCQGGYGPYAFAGYPAPVYQTAPPPVAPAAPEPKKAEAAAVQNVGYSYPAYYYYDYNYNYAYPYYQDYGHGR